MYTKIGGNCSYRPSGPFPPEPKKKKTFFRDGFLLEQPDNLTTSISSVYISLYIFVSNSLGVARSGGALGPDRQTASGGPVDRAPHTYYH